MERSKKKARKAKLVKNLLPDDMIVLEILSRLPVKSLYRFRCVCKSWSAFITVNKNHQNLFLLFKQHYSILDCYNLTSEIVKVESPIIKDYPLIPSLLNDAEIITSCDGWLLLSVCNNESHKLFLLNPFKEEYKVFPPYATRYATRVQHHVKSYGICYDFSGNDYKVVCIVGRGTPNAKPSFSVFSFKTNSWTSIRFLPDWVGKDTCFSTAVSLNGASHWTIKWSGEILSFDLKDGFKKLPKPPERIFDENRFMLVALRGNLCAGGYSLWQCLVMGSMVVMEMKEYGVKESWMQVCRINLQGSYSMRPLAFTKRGELVIKVTEGHTRKFVIYNVEDNSSKTLMGLENLKNPVKMGIYADSSITLNCDCF